MLYSCFLGFLFTFCFLSVCSFCRVLLPPQAISSPRCLQRHLNSRQRTRPSALFTSQPPGRSNIPPYSLASLKTNIFLFDGARTSLSWEVRSHRPSKLRSNLRGHRCRPPGLSTMSAPHRPRASPLRFSGRRRFRAGGSPDFPSHRRKSASTLAASTPTEPVPERHIRGHHYNSLCRCHGGQRRPFRRY